MLTRMRRWRLTWQKKNHTVKGDSTSKLKEGSEGEVGDSCIPISVVKETEECIGKSTEIGSGVGDTMMEVEGLQQPQLQPCSHALEIGAEIQKEDGQVAIKGFIRSLSETQKLRPGIHLEVDLGQEHLNSQPIELVHCTSSSNEGGLKGEGYNSNSNDTIRDSISGSINNQTNQGPRSVTTKGGPKYPLAAGGFSGLIRRIGQESVGARRRKVQHKKKVPRSGAVPRPNAAICQHYSESDKLIEAQATVRRIGQYRNYIAHISDSSRYVSGIGRYGRKIHSDRYTVDNQVDCNNGENIEIDKRDATKITLIKKFEEDDENVKQEKNVEGAGIFGHLSDSILGRKGSLTIVCILNAIFGCLTALAPDFRTYTLLRFLTGFSTGGVGLCAFVLATEPVGLSKRGVAGMSTFYFFSTGIAFLSGIAYIFQSWRALYIATSIPSILFLVIILPFISESPRWFLIRGKTNEAMKIMQNIAKVNGKHFPDDVSLALDEEANNTTTNNKVEAKAANEAITGSVIDVVRSPLTRVRLFLSVAINFLCSVVYYGLSLNVVNLGTNLYLNVFLNAVAEMPAFLLTALLLDRYGRKPLAIGTQWFSGFFCIIGGLMGGFGIWKSLRMVCGILGIFGMAGTYNLLFVYTLELFPTVVRNAALGCATQAAQMGAILTPFVVVLGGGLPFAVFGVCGIAGGLLAFCLPETLNKPLYDTMGGLEKGENAENENA
ncbi:hypothetical protein TEA_004301 [Camellia sinensis var. sinensis]|uniref:Major facilitator superfamily (MFS) profile domain-containing protein n=1 Tax=Camellia sinensis var. sinensis TaxID=542762 RepID=A0A4S4E5T1_CAMSN|nr:hypothetical protein TEA_004301 [Camellia sinensis var. sinensis]